MVGPSLTAGMLVDGSHGNATPNITRWGSLPCHYSLALPLFHSYLNIHITIYCNINSSKRHPYTPTNQPIDFYRIFVPNLTHFPPHLGTQPAREWVRWTGVEKPGMQTRCFSFRAKIPHKTSSFKDVSSYPLRPPPATPTAFKHVLMGTKRSGQYVVNM